jgi:fumarate hydratase class II
MPGKVNPVIPEVVLQVAAQVIGNDTAVSIGGMQGQFELNVRVPLIARNVLQSIHLLSTASTALAEKVVDGVAVNKEGTDRSAAATLAVATALNEHIGYDKATTIVQKAAKTGRMLRDVALEEGVDAELYDRVIDLRRIAAGSQADALDAAKKPARSRRSSSGSSNGSASNGGGSGGTRRRRTQRASA